jgi:hypothetical protein
LNRQGREEHEELKLESGLNRCLSGNCWMKRIASIKKGQYAFSLSHLLLEIPESTTYSSCESGLNTFVLGALGGSIDRVGFGNKLLPVFFRPVGQALTLKLSLGPS